MKPVWVKYLQMGRRTQEITLDTTNPIFPVRLSVEINELGMIMRFAGPDGQLVGMAAVTWEKLA